MATAITYKTGESASKLRTVLVDDARKSIVLLPAGRLEVMVGKQLHGQRACRHEFWDEVLGTDGDDFAVLMEQVTQVREVGPIKIKKGCRK